MRLGDFRSVPRLYWRSPSGPRRNCQAVSNHDSSELHLTATPPRPSIRLSRSRRLDARHRIRQFLRGSGCHALGLNPSNLEFVGKTGRLLTGGERRLATLNSLGLRRLSCGSKRDAQQIADDCANYFDRERNPYRRWFDRLEPLLKAIGASYYDGTACHLDLVQWATNLQV